MVAMATGGCSSVFNFYTEPFLKSPGQTVVFQHPLLCDLNYCMVLCERVHPCLQLFCQGWEVWAGEFLPQECLKAVPLLDVFEGGIASPMTKNGIQLWTW